MKDKGEASYVLGVKIFSDRLKQLLDLSQDTYIQKMLRSYHMRDCKPMDIPIEKNLSLSLDMCLKTHNEKKQMSKVPNFSVVSSLMYAMMCTRPELVSRFQSNPGQKHWMTVKRILRYLKGTSKYVLCYQGKEFLLVGYTNVD